MTTRDLQDIDIKRMIIALCNEERKQGKGAPIMYLNLFKYPYLRSLIPSKLDNLLEEQLWELYQNLKYLR